VSIRSNDVMNDAIGDHWMMESDSTHAYRLVDPYGINNQYIKSGGNAEWMNTHICYHTDAACNDRLFFVHHWLPSLNPNVDDDDDDDVEQRPPLVAPRLGPTGEPLAVIDIWATVCDAHGHIQLCRIWQWYESDGGKGDEPLITDATKVYWINSYLVVMEHDDNSLTVYDMTPLLNQYSSSSSSSFPSSDREAMVSIDDTTNSGGQHGIPSSSPHQEYETKGALHGVPIAKYHHASINDLMTLKMMPSPRYAPLMMMYTIVKALHGEDVFAISLSSSSSSTTTSLIPSSSLFARLRSPSSSISSLMSLPFDLVLFILQYAASW
jgi:hypothetical protein